MATSTSASKGSSARIDHRMPHRLYVFTSSTRPIRTVARAAIFFLKVFPMLPSRPVDWVTKPPMIEKVRYPTRCGQAEGDLYLGLVLIGHALIHLAIIPGGMQGADGRTGWSGQSWLLDQFLSPSVIWAIGIVLVIGTILFYVTGGLGVLGVPFLNGDGKPQPSSPLSCRFCSSR